MSPALANAISEHRNELTRDEALRFAEEQTRKYFDMSIEQFMAAAEADELPVDDPMVVHVALLTGVSLHSC